jgi:cytochrome P450
VAALVPMMVECTEALARRWERQPATAPVEITREMSGLALDIVCRALFGASVEGWKERFAENMAFGVAYANWLRASTTASSSTSASPSSPPATRPPR